MLLKTSFRQIFGLGLAVFLIVATFGLLTRMVFAQVQNIDEIAKQGLTLTAIPARIGDDNSLQGEPGKTVQLAVKVMNNSKQSLTIRSLVEDFVIGEDGRTPQPVEGTADSRWSLASWMQVVNPTNQVPANSVATVTILIKVPANALPGGRYAMVMHSPVVGNEAAPGASAGISQRVGTLVYLRIPGPVHEEAYLRNIQIPRWREYGPVPIAYSLESMSDVHIRPQTKITIRDWFGRRITNIDVPTANVFPYTQRAFATKWQQVWGFGRYTAEIGVVYGENNLTTAAKVAFWIVPIRLIIITIIVILLIVGIIIWGRRRWQKSQRVEQEQIAILEDRIRQLEEEQGKME